MTQEDHEDHDRALGDFITRIAFAVKDLVVALHAEPVLQHNVQFALADVERSVMRAVREYRQQMEQIKQDRAD